MFTSLFIFVFMRIQSRKSAGCRRASVNPSLLALSADGMKLLACFQLSDSRFVYGRADSFLGLFFLCLSSYCHALKY